MLIDHYGFGHIGIAGRHYDADVIIFPDRVQERWRRREGHQLAVEDLTTVFTAAPQQLVIGTGCYGRMQVPEETLGALQAAGIEIVVAKTGKAVSEYNRLQEKYARSVAALHLTC